jgi:hypothetical protein
MAVKDKNTAPIARSKNGFIAAIETCYLLYIKVNLGDFA